MLCVTAETQAQDSCGSKTPKCTLRVSKISLNTQTHDARNLAHPLPTSLGDERRTLGKKGLRQEYVLLLLNGCFTRLFTLSTLSSLCLSSYKLSSIPLKMREVTPLYRIRPLTRCCHNLVKCVAIYAF